MSGTGAPTTSETNLATRATHGAAWTYGASGINAMLNIMFLAVMARLLEPAVFGLFALAQVVLRFGQYFNEMGIGSALVQKRDLSAADERTAWTLLLVASSAATAALWALAPLATAYFGAPELTQVVRVSATLLILQATHSLPLALLRRQLQFRAYAIIDVVSYAVGYGPVAIACGLAGMGIWALVYAQIGQTLVLVALSWLVTRRHIVLGWNAPSAKALLGYGSQASVVGFLAFLSHSVDTLLGGRMVSLADMGVYNRGKMITALPMHHVNGGLSRILFPLFSALSGEPARQAAVFLRGMRMLALALIPLSTVLCLFAEPLVLLLLGPTWHGAVPVAQVCAWATACALLSSPIESLLDAQAALTTRMTVHVLRLAVISAGVLLCAVPSGYALGVAYLAGQGVALLAIAVGARTIVPLVSIASALGPGVLAGAGALIGYVGATHALDALSSGSEVVRFTVLGLCTSLGIAGASMLPAMRTCRTEIAGLMGRVIGGSRAVG